MSGKLIPARKDISDDHKWDLSGLFESDNSWESLFSASEEDLVVYDRYKGHLKDSVAIFKEAIEFHLGLTRKLEKVYTYAHLKSDEDKSDQHYLGLHQRALNLFTRASESASFMTPEMQAIADDVINQYLADDSLNEFKFYLEKILRYKPHTRSESEEHILAMTREIANGPSQVFGQLDNVDLDFGSIADENGREVELSHGNFSTFLINPSRNVRRKAFFQYYQAYQNHRHTLAATLAQSIKKDLFYTRARKFSNCRVSALFSDNVSETVYDNLMQTVKRNVAPLFKYLNFRQKVLGLNELHFYDTYVPIIEDVEFRMPYEEAVEVSIRAIEPLGEAYGRILKQGLLGGWVDRYENRGKRSGAYSSGCYDSPPYILLNYEENNINSLYTLMHEAGHSMHSYYSKKNQPYVNHDYTIFVAEVASTFNEALLSRYLLEFYKDNPKMIAYILNREIDNIRATLFRQTMFAEFEKITHTIVETNHPLTLDVICQEYRKLLQIYFGNALTLDPELSLECLRIPHFYSAFYVYKYATGVSAAIALADQVVAEGNSARQAYLNFLKLGGSKFPLDELLDAGVDMSSAEPVEQAIQHFRNLVDRLMEVYYLNIV
ncbi:Oligoendopeptidase F [Olavius sp. associated proteobacterium Delta 1]|nr:Oligoendopeptidase F [Olavius sp. associated proteobacterium Delta 1]